MPGIRCLKIESEIEAGGCSESSFPLASREREKNRGPLLFLTARAIEGRAPVLHDALHRALAAVAAGFALAVVDAEIVLEHAKLAIGALVVAQGRAARFDRILQHRLDRLDQA